MTIRPSRKLPSFLYNAEQLTKQRQICRADRQKKEIEFILETRKLQRKHLFCKRKPSVLKNKKRHNTKSKGNNVISTKIAPRLRFLAHQAALVGQGRHVEHAANELHVPLGDSTRFGLQSVTSLLEIGHFRLQSDDLRDK